LGERFKKGNIAFAGKKKRRPKERTVKKGPKEQSGRDSKRQIAFEHERFYWGERGGVRETEERQDERGESAAQRRR